MKKKANQATATIVNRRARFDYELGDEMTAGVVLSGVEVKAIRQGHAQLRGAFVSIKNDELWLNNASISVRPTHLPGKIESTVDTSPRKLLVNKRQLKELAEAKQQGLTIVPLRISNRTRFIKVVIATGKGKKQYDKRQTIKPRDIERDVAKNR